MLNWEKKAHQIGGESIYLHSNLSKNVLLNNKGERAAHSSHGHAWVWLWHEWHIQVRPHPLGQTPENQYNPKMSPKPIQACHSFPNIALFQTHTRTKSNERKQIKLNKSTKRTKSKQHRQYQSAAVFNKEVCINTIRCFFQLWFVSAWILPPIQKEWWKLNRANRACVLWGNVQSKCVWWCSSLPGAQVSQWTGSCSGWVNEVSPQEDVSVHLWVPTLSGQCGNQDKPRAKCW